MSFPDPRGNPCSSASAAARDRAETALWRMMSFYDTPLADLDAAASIDDGWCLPHLMKAGYLASLSEAAFDAEAEAHLHQARARMRHATPRERAHLDALAAILEGRWVLACRIWEDLLIEHPRDALALQWAHLWDFYRGDVVALRQRPARSLPEWDESDALFPHVLALHAFGLEENHLHGPAEEAGRRALDIEPRSPWAIHAVAHVMDAEGRFEEGAAWLRQHRAAWAEGNGFAVHLWWHKALFRIEAMDTEGTLRLIDAHLVPAELSITLQRLDGVSLLWRLMLLGEETAARFSALVESWNPDPASAGHYAFNDVHAVLAMLGAGQVSRAESWVARCAQRALIPSDASRTNHLMAREVGLPLMRGLLALARGDADGSVDMIAAVRSGATRLGGSHAQRDLIDQTLLAAAARGGRHSLGRALLNERRMTKPLTPLTRHWIERLARPTETRA